MTEIVDAHLHLLWWICRGTLRLKPVSVSIVMPGELKQSREGGEPRMFILIHILTLISPWWKCGSPETIMTLIRPLGMSLFC